MAKNPRKRRPSVKHAPTKRAKSSDRAARAEKEAYVRSLIAHGQAAKAGPDGKLPPGAKHELVEDDKGEVTVVRRRFSSF